MRVFSFPPLNCDLSISLLSLPLLLSYTLIGKRRDLSNICSEPSFCHLAAHHLTNSGHKYHFQQFETTDHALMGLPWVLSYHRISHLHIRRKVNMRRASLFVSLLPLSSSSSSECNGVTRIYQRIKKYTLILNTEKKNNFKYMSLTVLLVKEIGIKKVDLLHLIFGLPSLASPWSNAVHWREHQIRCTSPNHCGEAHSLPQGWFSFKEAPIIKHLLE